MTHTKGPLVVVDGALDKGDGDTAPRWEVCAPQGEATAYCRRKENADLYAAAPDLLEALTECRNLMHADNPADGWADAIAAADAAILKAQQGGE